MSSPFSTFNAPPQLGERTSGVLLHPTSLPGPYGCGALGPAARDFVDRLASAHQSWWQMLPVVPPGDGFSPYSASSAFAGNPLLIDLDDLVDDGLLHDDEVEPIPSADTRADFDRAWIQHDKSLRAAWKRFRASAGSDSHLDAALQENAAWLPEYALWNALDRAHGGAPWTQWEAPLRRRENGALEAARREHAEEILFGVFVQMLFSRQWKALVTYAHERGVGLIGDIPIFVALGSADVWASRETFRVDLDGVPSVVSGVPPDYFSKTGQRWGNPLYRWAPMRRREYPWWIDRFRTTLSRFDAIRLDHFIGFARYWEVPAAEPTAEHGRWMRGPGAPFFEVLREHLGHLPLIAEDLGAVTPKVFALRDEFGLPGTKILQYAFGADPNAADFQPHNHPRRCVVYTGTHDNDTTAGWFNDQGSATRPAELVATERANVLRYVGGDGHEIHWDLIRAALGSVAETAILPLQDVLGLGTEARMNMPGRPDGNWAWRVRQEQLSVEAFNRLGEMTTTYGRARRGNVAR